MNSNVILFNGVAMTADRYSPWIPTHGALALNVHLSWIGTGTPVGELKVEFSNDPQVQKEVTTNVDSASTSAKRVDVTDDISSSSLLGDGLSVSGGTDGNTFIGIASPPRFFRVWYDRTSGGSASSVLSGWCQISGS